MPIAGIFLWIGSAKVCQQKVVFPQKRSITFGSLLPKFRQIGVPSIPLILVILNLSNCPSVLWNPKCPLFERKTTSDWKWFTSWFSIPPLSSWLLYACMHAKSLQSCLTLCNPMDNSPPGPSLHRILQARILEWAAISFSPGCFKQLPKLRSASFLWSRINEE